ncbi:MULTISPECIES: hypothetical protein [Lacticaseibacillus]|uniref:DUF5085 family protein n=2 Tax=Lacticaseibacillus TaxID=2759736 RepID=A0AAN1EZY2_LACCA|nr:MULTISPECIES: hypothetical protein [Lacticaseibacillus]ARY92237.1 hypothetical protein BGL52_10925 [Lacticaseibacillus casei]KAB1971287.1 hypothetical protein F9B82_02035 [Lacticaseibacillus casei]WLV80145.1 hypothetical protein LACSTY_002196 [Lacticaseibacillus sp. NCIMB 15473]WNX24104.1 hypothetical protein RWA15_10700 [Lacticaseibacillus casei]WNX26878.1 hypothetical protein RWA16_10705 [Lacticaseibacillus casei]
MANTLDEVAFEMHNLAHKQLETSYTEFMTLLSVTEQLVYERGFYKNGPTMIALKPTEFEQEKQTYDVYIPVNESVTNGTFENVDELKYDRALHTRVPFDEGLQATLDEMKDYLKSAGVVYQDQLLLVMTQVYEEYWVDLLIPMTEKVAE